MVEFKDMLNKPLESVALDSGKTEIRFKFKDGSSRAFGVEGECCSTSWIEHLEMPESVDGAVILSVEGSDGVPWDGHECKNEKPGDWSNLCGHDSLSVYNTKFRTDKGDIVLEFRNDSNGYYGGRLVDAN